MANFNAAHKAALDDLLLDSPLVRPGKMFDFPAYHVGKPKSIHFTAAQQEESTA